MIQLSIEVADKPGELANLVGTMAEENIDIKALYLGLSPEKKGIGIVKMIVTNPNSAQKVLQSHDFTVTEETVVVTALEDNPGGLYAILKTLQNEDVNINHIYSFVSRIEGKALSVFGFNDPEKAMKVIRDKGIKIIDHPAKVDANAKVPNEPDLSAYVGGVFYW